MSGSYVFPCSLVTQGKMPSFGVYLGGQSFTVPGNYMWSSHHNSTHCSGVLESAGANSQEAILGDMFLRTQYVVLDYTGSGSVGFADKAKLDAAPLP